MLVVTYMKSEYDCSQAHEKRFTIICHEHVVYPFRDVNNLLKPVKQGLKLLTRLLV